MTCEQVECDGHLGRFDSCRDEVLHVWSLDASDGVGDMDYGSHFSLMVVAEPEMGETYYDQRQVMVAAGYYVVVARDSGGVTVWEYATLVEAEAEMAVQLAAYERYLEEGDNE